MKSKMFIILLIVIAAIFSSGCITIEDDTSSNNSSSAPNINKTFSNGGISFTYPGNWSVDNMSQKQESTPNIENLGMFITPDGDSFVIDREAVLYTGENSIEKFKNVTKNDLVQSGAKITKENTKTINGLKIYEIYLEHGLFDKGIFIITGKNNIMYELQFNGDENTLKKYSSALNQIESTIKIE